MAMFQNDDRRLVLVEVSKLKSHPLTNTCFPRHHRRCLRTTEAGGEIRQDRPDRDHGGQCDHRWSPESTGCEGGGREKIPAWIRDDLKDQRAIDNRFITANLNRRQMSRLDQARAYKRLKEIHGKYGRAKGDTRDFLAKQFGVSGRTLDRYLRVLETPKVVQEAVDDRKLSMQDGVDVSFLEPEYRTRSPA